MPGVNFCACYKVRNDLIIFLFSILSEVVSWAHSMKCQFQVSSCVMVLPFLRNEESNSDSPLSTPFSQQAIQKVTHSLLANEQSDKVTFWWDSGRVQNDSICEWQLLLLERYMSQCNRLGPYLTSLFPPKKRANLHKSSKLFIICLQPTSSLMYHDSYP